MICLYGYALATFLPAVILCIIPLGILQWIFMLGACVGSTNFLFSNLRYHTEIKQPILIGILGALQLFLTLFLKLTFLTLIEI
jgi:hypothetical protein